MPTISIDWPQIDASSSTILGRESAPEDDRPPSQAPAGLAPTSQAPTDPAPTSQAPGGRAPTDQAPTDPAPTATAPQSAPTATSEAPAPAPVTAPAATTAPEISPPAAVPEAAGDGPVVVVRPGDTLWRIAAERLPGATDAQVDDGWRRWYVANRATIGPDPDVILPGQQLRAPGDGAGTVRTASARPAMPGVSS